MGNNEIVYQVIETGKLLVVFEYIWNAETYSLDAFSCCSCDPGDPWWEDTIAKNSPELKSIYELRHESVSNH